MDPERVLDDLGAVLGGEVLGHAGLEVVPAPESLSRAALTIIWWDASTLVAISASRNSTAWCSAIFLPNVSRCWAYAMPSSKARRDTPQARAATLTRPTSTPSIIW